jgi:hypothetical protein
LTCAAKLFYNECPKLHAEDVKWKEFKYAFSERFRNVHSDKLHFIQLQIARQVHRQLQGNGLCVTLMIRWHSATTEKIPTGCDGKTGSVGKYKED